VRVAGVGLAAAVAVGLVSSCGTALPVEAAVPTGSPATVTGAPVATTAPTPTTAGPTGGGSQVTGSTQVPPGAPTVQLERGDEGSGVLALQERLTALGYWLGEPDGRFGRSTEQAVFALQGVAGLRRDGVVVPATRAALDDGARPVPRSSSGVVTEIDRDAGVIAFVRDGAVDLVLHTSTGTFEEYTHDGRRLLADTPEGRFAVSWSVDGWRDGALGRLYRPRYFHPDGIAVHGYPSVPAYPASHGCARVSMAAMDMIWARGLMPSGSTVLVH
jgi:peptidoglycan hydrolase-like protein with peptidoglycan-binding domain